MGTTRIALEVGKSYTWTRGNETLSVTAVASPWAENRIKQLEAALLRMTAIIETQTEPDIDALHDVARDALRQ